MLEVFIEGRDRNNSYDIFLRTSVEPELIYLLSPSHLSSFTDAGMDKESSLLMDKRDENW